MLEAEGRVVLWLQPLSRKSELLQEGWRPVQLSAVDKAPQVVLSDDRRTATSAKGYRMVHCTASRISCFRSHVWGTRRAWP